MRKHFLILMLLTLLPLAGWAQVDISGVTPTIGADSYEYSGGTPVISMTVLSPSTSTAIPTSNYDLVYYNENEAPIEASAVKNVGTYFVAAKAKDATSYTGTTLKKQFTITKKALTVKYDGATTVTLYKVYGAANPAFDQTKISFEGYIGTELSTAEKIAATISGTMSYTVDKQTATMRPASVGDTHITGVTAGHAMTISGLSATNYSFTYPTGKLEIRQIALAPTPGTIPADGKNYFTYAKNPGTLTYDGNPQVASYTIKYYDAQGNENILAVSTGTSGDDVKEYKFKEFAYKATAEAAYAAATAAHTNAGFYRATIEAEDKGNYYGTLVLSATGLDFEIEKRNVWVYVNDDTKVYDGTPYDVTYGAAKVTYTQLKGLTAAEVNNVTIAYADEAGLTDADKKSVNETGFRMIPVVADNSNLRNNHIVNIMNTGRWKITKRPIKVTAKPQTITFGDPAPLFAATETYITLEAHGTDKGLINTADPALAAEKNLILAALSIGLNGTYTEVNEDPGYEGAIVVGLSTDPAKAAAVAAVSNYDIQPVAGTYKIMGAHYTIVAKPKSITYGKEYDLTDFEYFTNGADVADGQTVTFELWKNGKKLNTLPKDAGDYEIRIVEKDAYLPTGYTLPITYVSETFTIKPKKVYPVLGDQTLLVGDKKAALLKNKVSFVEELTPDPDDYVDGLAYENDVIGFDLDFNGLTVGTDVHDATSADAANALLVGALDWTGSTADGSKFNDAGCMTAADYNTKVSPATAVSSGDDITAAHIIAAKNYNKTLAGAQEAGMLIKVSTYNTGVKIAGVASTPQKPNQNANYDITWTGVTGKLIVLSNAGLALNSDDNDLANVTKLDTKAFTNITIDLSGRNEQKLPNDAADKRFWDAKQWNTLVLPFDITVADLSKAFGYAIVNVVNPTKTTTDNVAFKLEMDMIPANTPFLIKTTKKLKDAVAANCISTTGIITFTEEHTVKAPTAAQKAGVEAGMGYKFVPVYETMTIDKDMSVLRFLLGNYEKWAYISSTSTNVWDLIPFTAYVDLTPAGSNAHEVTFTMEEADGSTTTVRSIEADGINNNVADFAKGWYTIDGMKLNAAPAQKGVYILNGKKVVVK